MKGEQTGEEDKK